MFKMLLILSFPWPERMVSRGPKNFKTGMRNMGVKMDAVLVFGGIWAVESLALVVLFQKSHEAKKGQCSCWQRRF